MHKIIIISDKPHITHILQILNLSDEAFDIVALFCSDKDFFEINGFETYPLDNLLDISSLDYDYIINFNAHHEQIYNILKKFVSRDKFLDSKQLSELALTPTQRMQLLKEQLHSAYPNPKPHILQYGDFSYGSPNFQTEAEDVQCKIGKFCSIGPDVKIFLKIDHQPLCCSTYPFNSLMPNFPEITEHPCSKGDVIIGNDVWIGNGATILSGVTIGNGAVIGADAVVSKDVPPYAIVVGNPAKIVKYRFSEENIQRLEKIHWWNWSYEHIYNAIPLLQSRDIDALYEYWINHVNV